MARRNWSFIGRGPVYMRERGVNGPRLPIGNVSQLNFAAEEEVVNQPDYTSPGGGNANTVRKLSNMTMEMTMLDLSPENVALALRGSVNRVAGGSAVTGEQHTAYQGGLIVFNSQPDISDHANTLTVTIDPDGTATSASPGVDYEVTRAGIIVLEDGAITDGDIIEVAYDKSAHAVVEALTKAGIEMELVWDGLNEAQSGKAVTVIGHRVKPGLTQALALIGDEFSELPITGDVLSDPTITGDEVSRFFRMLVEE